MIRIKNKIRIRLFLNFELNEMKKLNGGGIINPVFGKN